MSCPLHTLFSSRNTLPVLPELAVRPEARDSRRGGGENCK